MHVIKEKFNPLPQCLRGETIKLLFYITLFKKNGLSSSILSRTGRWQENVLFLFDHL